jgi:hypothetical protein
MQARECLYFSILESSFCWAVLSDIVFTSPSDLKNTQRTTHPICMEGQGPIHTERISQTSIIPIYDRQNRPRCYDN